MTRFFIFCLPRSRSAWLSNLLSIDSVICLHEALLGCRSLDEMELKLSATGADVAGCADTGMTLFTDRIVERYPDARFVILARDLTGYIDNMLKLGSSKQHARNMLADFNGAIETLSALGDRTLIVHSQHLDGYGVCQRIWEHIGMTTTLNRARFDMLRDLKVEVMLDRMQARVEAHKDEIRELFSEVL